VPPADRPAASPSSRSKIRPRASAGRAAPREAFYAKNPGVLQSAHTASNPRFTLFAQPLKPRQSEAYPANAHGKHMGVAFNTHDREIEDIGLATSRDDGVAIRGRNDRQPLPDGDLVAKIAPHDEMRHVFELADIDLRGSGAPEGSTATSA
jgi:hypothetical protein